MPRGPRPEKPYPDFPLYPLPNGQWGKKICGVMRYFGVWADHEAALAKYVNEREDLHKGLLPRSRALERTDLATVQYLSNHFLQTQEERSRRGEITVRTFGDYLRVCKLLVEFFGEKKKASDVGPNDFQAFRQSFPKTWGLQSQSDVIQRVRTLFAYGVKNELISDLPKFGSEFNKPNAASIRKKKQASIAKSGTLDLSAEEIINMIGSANGFLKSCILLGVNAAYGNNDCSELTKKVIDLKSGWIDFPRPKTGVPRRVKLWPETVTALQEYQAERAEPFDPKDAHRFFLTTQGRPLVWHNLSAGKHSQTNNLTTAFSKLQEKLGYRRSGVGFYSLRRTFSTIASGGRDSVAVDLVMGHLDATMAARYRQWIDDARIEAVCNIVRHWLYPERDSGN